MDQSLSKLFKLKNKTSLRASSWDKSGKNKDFITLHSGETIELANIKGPGIINHIYLTSILQNPLDFRYSVIRLYWDAEENPSVEVPLGDFFGVCNCRVRPIDSLMVSINKGASGSYGLNMYFPMPFLESARIEIENQGPETFGGFNRGLWYHIDYELVENAEIEDAAYFHASWNRENPTKTSEDVKERHKNLQNWRGKNLTGKENYEILTIRGDGQLVGLILCVDNLHDIWYGEGDDMIFIDDDSWPPSFHGTGTEEVFGGGACPLEEYSRAYHGFHLIEHEDYSGNNGMYRWFIRDPIRFKKRVRWTIEHGHANNLENDYSSVAYWYQKEPHEPFSPLPDVKKRLPRMPDDFDELWSEIHQEGLKAFALAPRLQEFTELNVSKLVQDAAFGLLEGRFQNVKQSLKTLKELMEKAT